MLRLAPLLALVMLAGTPALAGLRCGQPPFDGLPELAAIHDDIAAAVADFPALNDALHDDVALCLSDELLVARGFFEPDTRRIVLASHLPRGLMLAVAVHELRHLQQYGGGQCPTLALSMQAYARAVFAMEADASVTSITVAATLRDAGRPAMWDALAGWPMQADLTRVHADSMAETGDPVRAASATFAAWYDSDARMAAYYVASCMDYLDQLEESHLLPRYGDLWDGFYDDLCRLPDGRPYPCAQP